MGYALKIPGGLLSCCYDEFDCPICTCHHTGEDYEDKLVKYFKSEARRGYLVIKCKGCKRRLGVTVDILGDVVVWEEDSRVIKRAAK